MLKIKQKVTSNARFFEILLVGFVTIPFIFSLLKPGFFTVYDDMQVIRLDQLHKCVLDGQIPCRWVPDLGYGYGYPLYQYYAPLPYYVMESFHLIGFSLISSVKIGYLLSVPLSAIFFYVFLRNFSGKLSSLIGAFLYTYAPFRAASIYVRGAMGEAWGFFSLAFIFWSTERLLKNRNMNSALFFSLSVFVLILTHNLTAIMAAPFVTAWIIIRLYDVQEKSKIFKLIIFGGVLGMGMSIFFWLPLLFQRSWVYLETLTYGYFNYVNHFLSFREIFFDVKWGYGPSDIGRDDALLGLGPIHFLVAILGFLLSIYYYKKSKIIPVYLAISLLFYSFLAHSKSSVIWQNLSFMSFFQFPWRFIMIATFAASALGGFMLNIKSRVGIAIALIILSATSIYSDYYQPKDRIFITDEEKLSGENLEKQITASIYDYLPKSASYAPRQKALNEPYVESGVANIEDIRRGTNWYNFRVVAESESLIVVPSYNFPEWSVNVDDQEAGISSYSDLGLVSFIIREGDHDIKVFLKKTRVQGLSDWLSLISISFFIGIFFYENKRIFKKIQK